MVSIQGSNTTQNWNRGGGHPGCDSRACTEEVARETINVRTVDNVV